MELKIKRYLKRKLRVRSKVTGTAKSPRLTVFKSNTHIYGQLVDDIKQVTLVSASDLKVKTGKKTEKAEKVGEELAKKAIAKEIKKVAFDGMDLDFMEESKL